MRAGGKVMSSSHVLAKAPNEPGQRSPAAPVGINRGFNFVTVLDRGYGCIRILILSLHELE